MNRNPIKHVKFSDIDYFQPTVNAGGSNIPFKPVTHEFRQQLIQSVNSIQNQLVSTDSRYSIGVTAAVVELESKAVAKSHRPRDVFNQKTCEFIGDIGFARFLIKATDAGLLALSSKIQTASTKAAIKDLSTIKSIEAYQVPVELSQSHNAVSVRLFDFKSSEQNQLLAEKFEASVKSMGGKFTKHPSNFVRLYKVKELDSNAARALSQFMGVKSVMASNAITVAPMTLSQQAKSIPTMNPPENKDHPVVGVVDSGVSSSCAPIDPWIVDRKVYVADSYRDFNHGTFVIVLTIRDIDKQQPVYDQMVRLMEDYNWEVSDLVVDTRMKVR